METKREIYFHRAARYLSCYVTLFVLTGVLFCLNLYAGTTAADGELYSAIVLRIRLPRMIAAFLLGGALSVSGFLLQMFFANPIAGPYILGVSSGARFAVALAMICALDRGLVLDSAAMIFAAFAGSALSMGLVLLLSGRVRRRSSLVICGVMIGYLCSAATDFAVMFADDAHIVNLHYWSMGSFAGTGWNAVRSMALATAAGAFLSFLLSKPMEAYQMGEAYARGAGVNLRRLRVELILLSSLLSGCATAFAGPVSFVGVAVPHLIKRLFGTARPVIVLPACFLGGGAFCLFCDLIARTAFAPAELNISSVTAVFGAPVVIWIMASRTAEKYP